ncbi:MAG: 6-pyruvoyl trahydropterin synthase family protein [Jeotgalicoccus sp.]
MNINDTQPPEEFKYFNEKVIINKHYEFTCDNRIFFSNTAFKDLKNHCYTFNLEISSIVNDTGLATDFHLIDKIYNEQIGIKLDGCLLNETLPEMNTTAENIAYWLFEQFDKHLPADDELLKVTLYETDKQGITIIK